MSTAPSRALETFPNPQIERDYIIEIRSPEFTCLCPKTGQPDFATLYLEYVPDRLCVELKSFKLYIWSFRNEGHFHEKVTNAILNDLVTATQPRYMRLRAEFNVRGGVYTNVTAEYRQRDWTPLPPPPGHLQRIGSTIPAVEPSHIPTEPVATTGAATMPNDHVAASASTPTVSEIHTPAPTPTPSIATTPSAESDARSDRFRMLARKRATPAAPATAPTPAEPERDLYIGLDLGTTGCRAAVLDAKQRVVAYAETGLSAPLRQNKQVTQDPSDWWKAVGHCLKQILSQVDAKRVHRLAVAGTSSTLLLCDKAGQPVTPGLMYNDSRAEAEVERIAAVTNGAAAHSASSSLAKLLWLQNTKSHARASYALHQADWISNRLTGSYGHSDYHNCLKLGYDPQTLRWPEWLATLEINTALLPKVHVPGELLGTVSSAIAKQLGLSPGTEIVAGTTDGVAAFLTTGASEPGHGVSVLGNTLVLKLLSEQPLVATQYGVYSHRLGRFWLVGGASNSGGAVLLQYFTPEQLEQMAPMLDPETNTDLNYYPLLGVGERFPINDPEMEPKLEPLPGDSTVFMQGIFEGVANIEARGYELLHDLGGPKLNALWTTGGGSQNPAWTRIRERTIGIRPRLAKLPNTACGAALLAMGVMQKTFI